MNKYKEALDYLKAFSEQWVVNYEILTKGNINNVDFTECDEHSKTLQELVDKATPMKVLNRKQHSKDSDAYGDCPICKTPLCDYTNPKGCGGCLQALDWSEDD